MCDILKQKLPRGSFKKGRCQAKWDQLSTTIGKNKEWYHVAAKYRLEYYHDQSVKQLVRTRTDNKLQPSEYSITHAFSMYQAIAI